MVHFRVGYCPATSLLCSFREPERIVYLFIQYILFACVTSQALCNIVLTLSGSNRCSVLRFLC